MWRADVKTTRTLYAAAPKGACDFPNSENATLAGNLYFWRLNPSPFNIRAVSKYVYGKARWISTASGSERASL